MTSPQAPLSDPLPASEVQENGELSRPPTCLIVLGMAGSGKTTTVQRLKSHLLESQQSGYVVNLDPAVQHLPYAPNLDIRDTVDYKQVMQQYNLGPNGAILTSLNLFTTKFDQVVTILEKRKNTTDFILMDTPGQIEVFTWSASGTIVSETLASLFPTVLVYVVDTPRATASPATFMANMLYACSILYRSRLPFVLVLNKTDVVPGDTLLGWMRDWEAFQGSLQSDPCPQTFLHGFLQSMGLVLDEFYTLFEPVAFSAASGHGVQSVLDACERARTDYFASYHPALMQRRQSQQQAQKMGQLEKLVHELNVEEKKRGENNQGASHE